MSDALVQSATIQLKAQAGGGFGSVPLDTPVLSSVTGTFGQDNEIIISGAGFSANRSGQVIYENFDSGIDGNLIDDIATFSQNDGATPAHKYKYATDDKYSGSKSAKLNFITGDSSAFRPMFNLPFAASKVFLSMKIKVSILNETDPSTNLKLPRLISESTDHGSLPSFGTTHDGGVYCYINDGASGQLFYGGGITQQWQTLLYYIDLGSEGIYDGSRFCKAFGTDNYTYSNYAGEDFSTVSNNGTGGIGANPNNWEPNGNILCRPNVEPDVLIRHALLPFFKRTQDVYDIWIDQVSINDSLESVFISPHPTWTQSKADFDSLVLQPMSSRTGTQVRVSCEVGDLGVTRYMYVVNSNGKANENGSAI